MSSLEEDEMLSPRQTDRVRAEFEALALPHLDALYSAGLRLTKNDRDAEDLVQDSFMRAFRFFDKFERGTNIKAWLFRILDQHLHQPLPSHRQRSETSSRAASARPSVSG